MATPPSPDQAPIARARSAGRKLASMIARLPGVSSAPPIPWISRATIRNSTLGATAQSSEASGEEPDPGLEDLPPPEPVPEAPPEQDQRGERQHIAVQDPLQGAGRGVQVLADLRQRHVPTTVPRRATPSPEPSQPVAVSTQRPPRRQNAHRTSSPPPSETSDADGWRQEKCSDRKRDGYDGTTGGVDGVPALLH